MISVKSEAPSLVMRPSYRGTASGLGVRRVVLGQVVEILGLVIDRQGDHAVESLDRILVRASSASARRCRVGHVRHLAQAASTGTKLFLVEDRSRIVLTEVTADRDDLHPVDGGRASPHTGRPVDARILQVPQLDEPIGEGVAACRASRAVG